MRRHCSNLEPDQQVKLAHYLAQHPALELIYRFKQRLSDLLLIKHRTRRQCRKLVPRLLWAIDQLRQAGLAQLVNLGEPLYAWREEIAAMWRFTRNNGITEGFHNKMELINRQAYGFRNFQNYRMRVKVLCSQEGLRSGSAPVFGVEPAMSFGVEPRWWARQDSNL